MISLLRVVIAVTIAIIAMMMVYLIFISPNEMLKSDDGSVAKCVYKRIEYVARLSKK